VTRLSPASTVPLVVCQSCMFGNDMTLHSTAPGLSPVFTRRLAHEGSQDVLLTRLDGSLNVAWIAHACGTKFDTAGGVGAAADAAIGN
jgi:hypothetical protein